MPPPQLAADTPVLDIFQPVLVRILIFGRIELQLIIHHRRQSHVGKVLHLQEPLHGKLRFDGHVGTFGETYLVGIGFHFLQQTGSSQVLLNLLAHIETVHTDIQAGSFTKRSVIIEDVDARQIVLLTQHVVVHIVGRSYLQTTGTELYIYVIVLDNRNNTSYQRNNHLLTLQPGILGVIRIDAHGCISHDGFRAGGSNHCITSFGVTFYHILQIVQLAVLFLIDYFLITKGGQCFRVPVHHTDTAVNQTFVIQVDKDLEHAFTAFLVHSESRTVPIAGSAQLAELLQDDATVFIGPFPGVLQKLVAGKVCLLDALCGKLVHHLGLGSNGSMVGSRHPAGILAFHAGTAYQNILYGIIKHVSHVQHTGDVWRRNDDGVRLTTIGFRTE